VIYFKIIKMPCATVVWKRVRGPSLEIPGFEVVTATSEITHSKLKPEKQKD
jgi:hypothetical protein